jgi:hypothetical protein
MGGFIHPPDASVCQTIIAAVSDFSIRHPALFIHPRDGRPYGLFIMAKSFE